MICTLFNSQTCSSIYNLQKVGMHGCHIVDWPAFGMPRIWRIGSPNQEQPITNDNIMVFSVQYVLQYKIGTWYLTGTGTGLPISTADPSPAPPRCFSTVRFTVQNRYLVPTGYRYRTPNFYCRSQPVFRRRLPSAAAHPPHTPSHPSHHWLDSSRTK